MDSLNWKNELGQNTLPASSDDVSINTPGITVTFSSSAPQSIHSLYSTATLVIDGGSLTTATNTKIASPGTVDVRAGSLYLGGGESTSSSGSFVVKFGANLQVSGQVLTVDSSVRGAGTVRLSDCTVAGTYAITGETDLNGSGGRTTFTETSKVTSVGKKLSVESGEADFGNTAIEVEDLYFAAERTGKFISGDVTVTHDLQWISGTWISGMKDRKAVTTLAADATAELAGSVGWFFDGRRLENYGTLTVEGAGTFTLLNGAEIDNYRKFETAGGASVAFVQSGDAPTAFNNQANASMVLGGGSVWFFVSTFNNSGSVDVQGGWLGFGSGYTQTAGETRLSGGSISSSVPLDIQGGLLTGSGPIYGGVVQHGRTAPGLSPGATGTINVTGDYVQPAMAEAGEPYTVDEGGTVQLYGSASNSRGALDIDIGGVDDDGQVRHDQLTVSGSVMLGGALNVTLIDGFNPQVGEQFTIIDNTGSNPIDGAFAALPEGAILSDTAGTSYFQISYTYPGGTDQYENDVVLTAVSGPADPPQGNTNLTFEWDFDGDIQRPDSARPGHCVEREPDQPVRSRLG